MCRSAIIGRVNAMAAISTKQASGPAARFGELNPTDIDVHQAAARTSSPARTNDKACAYNNAEINSPNVTPNKPYPGTLPNQYIPRTSRASAQPQRPVQTAQSPSVDGDLLL